MTVFRLASLAPCAALLFLFRHSAAFNLSPLSSGEGRTVGADFLARRRRQQSQEPAGVLHSGSLKAPLSNLYKPTKVRAFLDAWPENEEREMKAMTMLISDEAPLAPGSKTLMKVEEEDINKLMGLIRSTDSGDRCVLMAFVDKNVEGNPTGLLQVGSIAEVLTTESMMKTGEVPCRVVGRFGISVILSLKNELHAKVRRICDQKKPRLMNAQASKANLDALYSLYDRANGLEAEACKLSRDWEGEARANARPPLTQDLDYMLELEAAPDEQDIMSWASFVALQYHFDAKFRFWAVEQLDAEARLDVVRQGLQARVNQLQANLKIAKASKP